MATETEELERLKRSAILGRLEDDAKHGGAPGKHTRSESLVQRHERNPTAQSAAQIRDAAQAGVSGSGGVLPHGDAIQRAFGHHDISGIQAHVGGQAGSAAGAMGAEAYATGSSIAFRRQPDLHTAAHEAAHVVQQRSSLSLSGGVGSAGDRHERHADAVADRVVSGASAVDLLDQYGGGGGAAQVQGKCACGDCEICKAREASGREAGEGTAIQHKASEDVQLLVSNDVQLKADAVQMDRLGDAARAIGNFIDLLGPKMDLMRKIVDPSWIISAVEKVQADNDANPQHKMTMNLELLGAGVSTGAGAMAFANRIASCNDLKAVQALDKEFTSWKTKRVSTLKVELEKVVDSYRKIERGWMKTFSGHAPISKDPTNFNQGGQGAKLEFKPGSPQSTVTVETRVNATFGLTAQAAADNDGDGKPDVAPWKAAEKAHFMSQFQRQLDDVWSTHAGAVPPFRASAPPDHLLKDHPPKWSDLTAVLKAKVKQSTSNPHFQLTVNKEAPGENNRAFVSSGAGTFYMADADQGYHRSGKNKGKRNPNEQPTLAHEFTHMIGNPDEYAENSAAQSADPSTPASRAGDNAACKAHFDRIIADPTSTPAQVARARADWQALQNHATDMDPATPGFQSGIFPLAGRSDIPATCFAIRGTWADGPNHTRLRPGAQSERGGTNISGSAADAARLSDRGSQVRPYMREGIVQELKSMLTGVFTPEVSFDHNFKDMPVATALETIQARLQNIMHDVAVGATTGSPAPAQDHVQEGPGGHSH